MPEGRGWRLGVACHNRLFDGSPRDIDGGVMPQLLQQKRAWLLRFSLAQCPQAEHVRDVLRGVTA
jgi:hypothetical protein